MSEGSAPQSAEQKKTDILGRIAHFLNLDIAKKAITKEETPSSEAKGTSNSGSTAESPVPDGSAEAPTPETVVTNKKLTAEEKAAILAGEKTFQEGITSINHIIAPDSMQIDFDRVKVSGMHARTFFVYNYPRYIDSNWLSPVINIDATMDISMFVYPIDNNKIMKFLRNKVTQISAQIHMNQERGLVRDPALEAAFQDAEELRDELQRGSEKFFHFSLYYTVYTDDEKKLDQLSKQIQGILGGRLVLAKPANLQMEHAYNSTVPIATDELGVFRNMNTSPLSSTFPFTSSDLTSNEGILYGINRHNDSLIIFDRFKLPNANSVIFATSGAGKSFAVKLEILRSLMLGTDVIVIDPENEYQNLCNTVGGTYLNMSLNSDQRINPFDLPTPAAGVLEKPGDILRSNIITLTGMVKLMLGSLSPTEEAIVDKALIDTYALKGITLETENPHEKEPPTMEDLTNVLMNITGGENIAERLSKFTRGTFSGLFNKPTNINLNNGMVVFCIRDLEESLRSIAMYIVINYIWTIVRSSLKRRMLVVDEAWIMMQHEDSARFLFGLVKRARKYYLGVSTITQDVEDFVKSPFGKPIITNSSMQLLLKQSPAAVEPLGNIFNLTEGEKYMLLNSGVGQGLFFAGSKHVAIQIIASYSEKMVVSTNPEDVLAQQNK
ncbi:conjugal transfer protein TraC [Candidatus Gracilibacteria bacterium CG17_big_fil_post_rev_8_21_14_2_50_48_13]|nr:MAG: conjugal transfer protein TraC [Candidatus Gracilibacteria bacterium CG17_big_fil_post_rev_8_21_14_2_50_48_13]